MKPHPTVKEQRLGYLTDPENRWPALGCPVTHLQLGVVTWPILSKTGNMRNRLLHGLCSIEGELRPKRLRTHFTELSPCHPQGSITNHTPYEESNPRGVPLYPGFE